MVPSETQAIHDQTLEILSGWQAKGELDELSFERIEAQLRPLLSVSPCLLVALVARALGAPEAAIRRAASFGELFYASTSLVDDVQDGDADLADLTTALQMYALALRLAPPAIRDEVACCTALMAQGQRREMARRDWDVAAYAEVARLTSGSEFRALLAAAAQTANRAGEPWDRLGDALGQLVHYRCDRASEDSRLTVLDGAEVRTWVRGVTAELKAALDEVPPEARGPLRRAAGYAC